MFSFWAAFPFLRYVLWLMAGIVAGGLGFYQEPESWWLFNGLLSFSYVVLFFLRKKIPGYETGAGILACILLFSIGFSLIVEQMENLLPNDLPKESTYWLLKVETEAVPTPKTLKLQTRMLAYKEGNNWMETHGKTLLYIRRKEIEFFPAQGNLLVVKAKINPIPPPLNPAVFNYKRYLEVQGICCQAFITPGQLEFAGNTEGVFLPKEMAQDVRSFAVRQVEKYIGGKREAAIISSLVLGYRETLDQELVQAYSTAGTMHVLAVSGLHVGVLYLFLKFLFRSWRRRVHLKWISYLLSLLVLWGYAFLTGLTPSVLRAVIMFSIVEAAMLKKRKTSIYNSVGIAAFVLLLSDPNMLWAVGFQLSFLAVLGIVYLQPKISVWYKGEHKFLRKGWDYTAASLAAQFATFSLALYYFGQFPTYFFITNLVVVPAAFFILAGGFIFLLVSLLSNTLAAAGGWVLYYFVKFINWVVFTVEAFPYSRLNLQLTEPQLWLLLLALALTLLFFQYKNMRLATCLCLAFASLLVSFTYGVYREKNQHRVILYHIPGFSLLQLVEGREEFFVADEDLPSSQVQYQVQPNRKVLGVLKMGKENVLESSFQPAMDKNEYYSLIVWRGVRLVKIEKELPAPCVQQVPLSVDYILLTNNSVNDLEHLSCFFEGGFFIIDGSNHAFLQRKLVEQAKSLNLPYHLTSEAGAFELNL